MGQNSTRIGELYGSPPLPGPAEVLTLFSTLPLKSSKVSAGNQMSRGVCKEMVTCVSSMLMSQQLETWVEDGSKKLKMEKKGERGQEESRKGWEKEGLELEKHPQGALPGSSRVLS